MTVNWPSFR